MDRNELITEIQKLKKQKNAVIVAHNYQNPDIQDIADFVGDSLELAKISASLKENLIIFCGVFFMAETAHMLSPEKKVLLPVIDADCPMARMITKENVLEMKARYPKAAVVAYVNSTADVKSVTDICCTSANAMRVVNSLKENQIIFIPDRNLGQNIARFIPKEFFYWEGYCHVHESVKEEEVKKLREELKDFEIILHPEVNPAVAKYADKLLSTGGMLKYAQSVSGKKFVIGTEIGLVHRLKKLAPDNQYYNIGRDLVCPNMKKIRLENVFEALLYEKYPVVLEKEVREKAKNAIQKMLDLG